MMRTLAGHVVAFTGRLTSLSQKQAADLVRRHGGELAAAPALATLVVVGDPDNDPDAQARAGLAETATAQDLAGAPCATPGPPNAAAPDPRVIGEDVFCRLVGRVTPADLRQQFHSWRTLRARYPSLSADHLRYLEAWGLLPTVVRTPGDSYYGFADLATLKQVHAALDGGTPFRGIVRTLVAARAGQLSLDFRAEPVPAGQGTVVALTPRPARAVAESRHATGHEPGPLTQAETRFLEGEGLDTERRGSVEEAMRAYREAIALDPGFTPAMINLGNLHYALDQLAEAQALYFQAATIEPDCFEAHFNLGNIHHDTGRYALAAACYGRALRLQPEFADAHFYLAVALEKLGRSEEARPHWREYRQLAPDGEWAGLAREFSD
jgi:tetratricopeptide (TPR) repeat protein